MNKLQEGTSGLINKFIRFKTGGLAGDIPTGDVSESAARNAVKVLQSPNFLNLVKAAAKGKPEAVKGIENKLIHQKVYKDMFDSLPLSAQKAITKSGFVQWVSSQKEQAKE